MSKILIKQLRPHRQKVLTEDGEEMRLQQWANKKAASVMRQAGGDATGEQFTQARDALMREAVANPEEHGLNFMGERVPFEGQELEEPLSEPDMEAEKPQLPESIEQLRGGNLFDEQGKLRQTLPPQEDEDEEFNPDAEAEHLRRIMTSRDVAMRDAWSVLKQGPYDWQGSEYDTYCPRCHKGIYRENEDDLLLLRELGMCADCAMKG
jgi:hypothetical protein